jgi:hypothetical protein
MINTFFWKINSKTISLPDEDKTSRKRDISFFGRGAKLRKSGWKPSIFFMVVSLKTHSFWKHAKFADHGRTGYKVGSIEYH